MVDNASSLIKRALPLSQYIAQFTKVKASGSTTKFMAFCPFHDNTKSEAMSINDTDGVWNCFAGCGGGDIFAFWYMKHGYGPKDHAHFGEALEDLAKHTGVTLPERERKEGEKQEVSKTRIKRALGKLASAACDNLFKEDRDEYAAANDYLNERNMRDSIIEKYLIGVIPTEQSEAVRFITRACDDKEAAIAGGVLVKNTEDGSLYSPYMGRLVVPIFDVTGSVIGFGGRQIPGVKCANKGKWINPTTTPVYDKSKVMYGLDQLSGGDSAVVVEGYFDAIAITESEAAAVGVAACGTAFTTGHAETLRKVRELAFIFDGDEAGSKALSKAYWVSNKRKDATYVSLPEGTDPWELMYGGEGKKPDRKVLLNSMNSKNPLMEGCVQASHDTQESEADFDEWVANALAYLHDSFSKDQLIGAASQLRGVSRNSYTRTLSDVKIGRQIHRGDDADDKIIERVVTDPNTAPLIIRVLQMDNVERDAVFAMITKWDTYTEEMIADMFPGNDELDTDVFEKIITGGFDMDIERGRNADQAIAMLMPEPDAPIQDITRSLRSIITLMTPEARELAKTPNTPTFLRNQILGLRNLNAMSDKIHYQSFVLSTLIDIALDIKRFERTLERAEDE